MAAMSRALVEPGYDLASAPDEVLVDPQLPKLLRLFAGLMLRVKHSFLWERAPLTMRLLQSRSSLHRTFGEFGSRAHFSDILSQTITTRTRRFLEYLAADEDAEKLTPGIAGVARHELECIQAREPALALSWQVGMTFSRDTRARLILRRGVSMICYSAAPDSPGGCCEVPPAIASICAIYTATSTTFVSAPLAIGLLSSAKNRDFVASVFAPIASAAERDVAEQIIRAYLDEGIIGIERVY